MAFFARAEELSAEAKAFAVKNLRDLVQSYQNRRNPVGNTSGLEQLSQTWETAMAELNSAFAEREGTDDADLWDELFSENGTLARWEAAYQNSLISRQEKVARYESGTITGEVDEPEKIKEWNLGSVLYELQEDFTGIVQFAQDYDAEMARVRSEATMYAGLDHALTREISFDSEERRKNEGEKKERFSEASIINLTKIENYAEFAKEYENIASLSGEFGNLLQTRLQEIEKGEPNKKYVDYQQAVLEYVKPRIDQLQGSLTETAGTKEMTAIRTAEAAVVAAEEDVKTRQEEVEKARTAFGATQIEVERRIKEAEDTYVTKYKAEEDTINGRLNTLNKAEYREERIREATKAIEDAIETSEQEIAALEEEKKNPNSTFWADMQEQLLKSKQDGVFRKLASDTTMYRNGGLKNLHDVDLEIENQTDIAYREAFPKWQSEVNELVSDLQKQEMLETQSIAGDTANKIKELEKQKEALAQNLSDWQESNKITTDELEKSRNEYNELKNDERNRAEIIQKQLKGFADQKAMLLQKQEEAQRAEKLQSFSGFPEGKWRDLLDKTKEEYIKNAPAFLAAEAAKDMLEKIEEELAGETEIDLSKMSLADYSDPDKLESMKRKYCEKYKNDKELYEAKGKEFDSKMNMRRGSLEKLVTLTSSAYKLYTRIDENLDDRFAKSKTFDQKYGPIAVKKAANADEVSSNMKHDEKRTVAELKEDILRYRENARTLMYGARVYELEKKNDKSSQKKLELWLNQLDTEDRKNFLNDVNNITVSQNDLLENFDRKQRRQEELFNQVGKLEKEHKEEKEKIEKYSSDIKATETELKQQTEQFEDIQAWWKQMEKAEDKPDIVGAAVEKLAGYRKDGGQGIEAMQTNAAKLKEVLSKEPKRETMSSEKLDHLRKIKADFEQELAKAKEEDQRSFDKYLQKKKDGLAKLKEENSSAKIAEEIDAKIKKEVDDLTTRKENLQREKNIDIEVAGKDLLKAEEKLQKAQGLLEKSEEALDARNKELENCKIAGASVVEKYNSINGLIELYGKEAQLIPNLKDITEESNGRFKIIKDVEGLKADYDRAILAENERLNGIKEGLSGKMLKPEADRILGGVETFLKTADVGRADKSKENSDEYKDMNNALRSYAAKARNGLKTPESVVDELRNIKQFAQTYIQKKQDQFGHKVLGYYSNQAKVRLDYAQRLIDFCDNGIRKVEQVEPQVDAMKRSIDEQKRQPYSTTAEFFDGYVRSTLGKRGDIGNLKKENEFKVRKDTLLLKGKDLEAGESKAYKKGVEDAYNRQLRENKGPFTFHTVTDKAEVKQWIEEYRKLNLDRKKLEETAGIDKIFNKANVNAKNIPNKDIDPLVKDNNPLVM